MANLDQIMDFQADNLAVYKAGDTATISNGYLFGLGNSGGTAFFVTAFLPKTIPSGLTVTASGSFDSVRMANGTVKTNIPVVSTVLQKGDNLVMIQGNSSGLGANQLCVGVPSPSTGITLTFS